MKNYNVLIWIAVAAVVFGFMWWGGQLARLSNYWRETMEEMAKKCNWPTWAELKGSTIVVFISIVILGVFTMTVDWFFSNVVRLLT